MKDVYNASMNIKFPTFVLLLLGSLLCDRLKAQDQLILTQREQASVINEWLEYRMKHLLPELMDRTDIDMWVVISREYNEDPILKTFLPAQWFAARRRTMLLMYKAPDAGNVEAIAVARYDVGKSFQRAWDPEVEPDQWNRLITLIKERNPKKIGINVAEDFGHADGLAHTEHQLLKQYLGEDYSQRLVSAKDLAVGWLETRSQPEMDAYRQLQSIAHAIIAEGLSEKVITPGITTTEDVVWWYREKIKSLKLDTWFHPTVDLQRAEPETQNKGDFANKAEEEVILPGDLLHIDFGITYLRLNTDTQQMAYVLKLNEDEVPAYLQDAFSVGNRLQDILTSQFKTGSTGNEILRASRIIMQNEGIKGSIYSHPLGTHGHAAGPTIGMWDNQGDNPGHGDYPLFPHTVYAIELNASVFLSEWKKEVRILLEEGAYFDGDKVTYLNGRQKRILPIPRPKHMGR
ncbi:M24 family metallopeptidase [Pleomorphovibrio marinus]|uniref:M24 family metallopeptidase n=1 Tax=Pleomorphovibrio marinus TaxID=2164132 RepID=UPI001E58CAA1|nr:M24 family metallopeptidase [Pleomorphovibrio marinus]